MKKRVIVFVFLLASIVSKASLPDSLLLNLNPVRFKFYYENSHTIYAESGYFWGNNKGAHFSINYDGIVKSYQYLIISLRIGGGYSFAEQRDSLLRQEIIIPMAVHFQLTKVNTQAGGFRRYNIRNIFQKIIMKTNIDIGFGGYNFANRQNISPLLSLGFRHQSPEGGFMYRIGGDVHLDNIIRKNSFNTAYYGLLLSLGWTF
ncbi:MAG: hypothetical protein Fur0028_05070 [Bacteroidales bacterium]